MIGQGGGGGGFDWLSFAQKIGDINQTAYNQNADTSFSAVSDPAGFMWQTGQKAVRFANARKQQKRQNDFQDVQKKLMQTQITGQNLANQRDKENLDWRTNLRKIMMRGAY